MPVKKVLEIDGGNKSESFNVQLIDGNICIYNNETDATAWSVFITPSDWYEIKDFVNQQLMANK